MEVTDMPSPAEIWMMDSEWLIWWPLSETIQKVLFLLISPELILFLLMHPHGDIPIHSSLTNFSENMFHCSLLYTVFLASMVV